MKKLILNDGRNILVQSADAGDGIMRIRMILTSASELKELFSDPFANANMVLMDGNKKLQTFENYKILSYIKEEMGGIYEVELRQEEADTDSRIKGLEDKIAGISSDLQKGFAELTILISKIGGGTDV